MNKALRLGVLITTAAACAPTLPPFVVAETADVLDKGQIAVSGAVSGAVLTSDARTVGLCCSGGEGRVRLGVGHGQEVSANLAAMTSGDVWGVSSRIGWKRTLKSWAAVTAGTGSLLHFYSGQTVADLGGDVGAVISTPVRGAVVRAALYSGARLSLMVPALADPFTSSGVNASLNVPLGVAVHLGKVSCLYVEGGPLAVQTWYRAAPEVDSYQLFGIYGAVAFGVTLK